MYENYENCASSLSVNIQKCLLKKLQITNSGQLWIDKGILTKTSTRRHSQDFTLNSIKSQKLSRHSEAANLSCKFNFIGKCVTECSKTMQYKIISRACCSSHAKSTQLQDNFHINMTSLHAHTIKLYLMWFGGIVVTELQIAVVIQWQHACLRSERFQDQTRAVVLFCTKITAIGHTLHTYCSTQVNSAFHSTRDSI